MAQEPESGKNASGIAYTGKRKWGYDSEQVDAFLEHAHMLYDSEGVQLTQYDIQNVSFDLVKGGYVIAQVDAALARLERAVVDKQTTWEISQHGRVAWKAQTESLFRELDSHAERAQRERFKPGEGKEPSYDRKQVDRIIDQCLTKAADELGLEKLDEQSVRKLADVSSQTVANVIFTQRKGKHGYDERQVDHYLNSCVQLMTRLESYARVADFVGEPSSTNNADFTATANAGETQMITPLFATFDASADTPAEPTQPTMSMESFDALNKVEREIFTSPTVSPVSAPAVQTDVPSTAPVGPPVFQPTVSMPKPVEPESSQPGTQTETFDPLSAELPPSFSPEYTSPASTATTETKPFETAAKSPAVDSSLAALAQMANSVDTPEEDTFTLHVPELPTPSLPQLNVESVNDSPGSLALGGYTAQTAASASSTASNSSQNVTMSIFDSSVPSAQPTQNLASSQESDEKKEEKKPSSASSYTNSTNNLDIDIPDLLFPSFH